MKIIVQEDSTGCGIACAAMIAGENSYQAVKKKAMMLEIFTDDENLYSHTSHITKLLESYNVVIGKKKIPFNGWDHLPPIAILAIKYKENNTPPTWHWVVYENVGKGPRVYDPKKELKNNLRTDFGRMKPKWYIKVDHI